MKTLLLIVALLCSTASVSVAQAEAGKSTNASTISYNLGDLEKLDKLQLSEIYIAKLNRLYSILPYIAFEKLQPQKPNDLKIPSNNLNDKALSSLNSNIETLSKNVDSSLSNLGPYADKKNLMHSILFLQSIINRIELIGLGMDKLGFD